MKSKESCHIALGQRAAEELRSYAARTDGLVEAIEVISDEGRAGDVFYEYTEDNDDFLKFGSPELFAEDARKHVRNGGAVVKIVYGDDAPESAIAHIDEELLEISCRLATEK